MKLLVAKLIGFGIAIAGVICGGLSALAIALYFEGGMHRVHEAMQGGSVQAVHPTFLEVVCFSVGASVVSALSLFAFLRLGPTVGLFSREEQGAILLGLRTRRSHRGREP